ncbi:uncharacterized protein [Asterias amurensis]|uniref:uncharacterized protein n=1 Tax=Asterias amurensis TaxID=7602 RepID=UPI003AB5F72C
MECWKKFSYAVVKIRDGIAVVCTSWMSASNVNKHVLYSCWWPNCSSVKEVLKMAKKLEPFDETTWNQYQAVRLLNFSDSWEEILEMKKVIHKDSELSRYRNRHPHEANPGKESWFPTADVPRVPTAPVQKQNQSSFETIVELLKESLSELKELRKRVDRNTLLLEDLRHQGTDTSLLRLQEDAFHTHLEVALPVSTVEDLQALEMKLEDKELAKKMELKLGVLGGKNLASTGKSILSNLLTPKLAYQYNWTGKKGKMEFQSFENINRTIWEALRKNPITRDATKDDSKTCVISYLYNARDLKGGRMRRRMNEHSDVK